MEIALLSLNSRNKFEWHHLFPSASFGTLKAHLWYNFGFCKIINISANFNERAILLSNIICQRIQFAFSINCDFAFNITSIYST